jgi:hypothetical protein
MFGGSRGESGEGEDDTAAGFRGDADSLLDDHSSADAGPQHLGRAAC